MVSTTLIDQRGRRPSCRCRQLDGCQARRLNGPSPLLGFEITSGSHTAMPSVDRQLKTMAHHLRMALTLNYGVATVASLPASDRSHRARF
ncbi:hypothetical protein NXC14_PC00677 (plasmid) [Rhizobium sp. NXC14]|nr:hypothetical protein NXC14_PC00677 [Rhizobium sp. NXC14]